MVILQYSREYMCHPPASLGPRCHIYQQVGNAEIYSPTKSICYLLLLFLSFFFSLEPKKMYKPAVTTAAAAATPAVFPSILPTSGIDWEQQHL